MNRDAILKQATALANESPFAPGHVARWNALEDTLLGKLTIAELSSLRAHCETMPNMGAGVILAMIGDK